MIGHQQIIDYRRDGKKPSAIFIEFDSTPIKSRFDYDHPERQIAWKCYPVVYVIPTEIPDLRFVIDCKVLVFGIEWSESFYDFIDRLAKKKPKIIVATCYNENDNMMIWENNEWSAHAGTY